MPFTALKRDPGHPSGMGEFCGWLQSCHRHEGEHSIILRQNPLQ